MRGAWAALACALTLGAASAEAPLLRAQGWNARTPTFARDLTESPAECLVRTDKAIETGRALFRSPVLFGGPAARVGLSCESCHAGGRVNAHFYLPELSDAPGTADVTSEWASKVRGDGMRNPVAIPDLAGVGGRPSLGHKHEPSLEAFVRSVIVEEFQGPPPPRAAVDGVLAYLRALDPAACAAAPVAITLDTAADDVRRAMAAADGADAPTTSLLLYAAQDGIARIAERLPIPRFNADRRTLELLAGELGTMREGVAAGTDEARAGWMARFDAEVGQLERRQTLTYFNPRVLARALGPPPAP